jgi:hypothetical protein
MIGQDVRPASQTASNQMNIGNLIYATGLSSAATASTGNVGIRTSAPSEPFQVNLNGIGTWSVTSAGALAGSTNMTFSIGTTIYEGSNTIALGSAGVYGISSTASAFGSPDIGLSRGAAGKLYIGNGTQGDYSGTLVAANVGIGTTSPSTKLEVYDTSIAKILTNYNGTSTFKIETAAGFTTIGTVTNDPFPFVTNNTERMRISAAGNIGIGSTTPAASLDMSQKTDAIALPSGTSGQRPTPVNGMIRYNSSTPGIEAYYSSGWQALGSGGGGSSTITLGTATSATNPQRSGDATTGVYSATAGTVSIAASGTQIVEWSSAGENIVTGSLKLAGNNAFWVDNANYNMVIGASNAPTGIAQGGYQYGQYDIAIGYHALHANTTGGNNTAIGANALAANTTGTENTAIGASTLVVNTVGQYNTAIGDYSLYANTASNNTAVGSGAMTSNTGGALNTAIGMHALYTNTTGSNNTAVGWQALTVSTTATNNTAVGSSALAATTIGGGNSAIGYGALIANTSGTSNTAVGSLALYTNTTGFANTAIGYQAGYDITSGAHNIIIGDYTTSAVGVTTGSNNILIGQNIRPPSQTASDQMNIGNLLYATGLSSGATASTGNVGIGTTGPSQKLHVVGDSRFDGTIIFNGNSTSAYYDGTISQYGFSGFYNGGNVVIRNAYYDSSGALNGSAVFITAGVGGVRVMDTGAVGVGTTTPQATLDVNGYAKLKINSSAPATCDATHEGSLAYTGTTTHYMCFCDGASWKQVHSIATACTW